MVDPVSIDATSSNCIQQGGCKHHGSGAPFWQRIQPSTVHVALVAGLAKCINVESLGTIHAYLIKYHRLAHSSFAASLLLECKRPTFEDSLL